jgi:hypothetical protein
VLVRACRLAPVHDGVLCACKFTVLKSRLFLILENYDASQSFGIISSRAPENFASEPIRNHETIRCQIIVDQVVARLLPLMQSTFEPCTVGVKAVRLHGTFEHPIKANTVFSVISFVLSGDGHKRSHLAVKLCFQVSMKAPSRIFRYFVTKSKQLGPRTPSATFN